jgi:hypothetical protein
MLSYMLQQMLINRLLRFGLLYLLAFGFVSCARPGL